MKVCIYLRESILSGFLALIICLITLPASAATYTYDDLGRLTSVTSSSGQSRNYTYDAGGNVLSIVKTASVPVIISSDPANLAADVSVDKTITLQFEKNIEQGSNYANISLMAGQTPIAVTVTINAQNLTIDPTNNLDYVTQYVLTVPAGAVKVSSGTAENTEICIQFTTAALGLNMAGSDPLNNATAVPIGQIITITFDQNIQAGDNYTAISLTAGGQTIAATNSIAGSVLTIDPDADLTTATQYTLTLPAGALKNLDSTATSQEIVIKFVTQ